MMRNLAVQLAVAAVFIVSIAASADAQRRRSLPPLTPEEAELAMRYSIQRQLERRVSVPDSAALQQLINVAVRFRDSSRALMQRESIIRSELSREGYPQPPRTLNETRIGCLMNELTAVERRLFDLRLAERQEVSTILPPVSRYQYMRSQESVHDVIDDRRDYARDRRQRLVRSGVLPPAPEVVGPAGQTREQIAASICPA